MHVAATLHHSRDSKIAPQRAHCLQPPTAEHFPPRLLHRTLSPESTFCARFVRECPPLAALLSRFVRWLARRTLLAMLAACMSMGAGRENGTALQCTCCVMQLGVVWGSVVAVERRGAGWFRC